MPAKTAARESRDKVEISWRYPLIMAESINWPEDVKAGLGMMKKEHDIYMLKQLLRIRCYKINITIKNGSTRSGHMIVK